MSTTASPAKPRRSTDPAEFLRLLHQSGSVYEIRIFECPIFKGARKRATAGGFFDNPAEAGRWAKYYDTDRQPPGVYVTLNPVNPVFLARAANRIEDRTDAGAKDENIVCRRWLFLDIDSVREIAGISATENELKEAAALAKELRYELGRRSWPDPITCMSGNGIYLLYRIDLPNDDTSTLLVQNVLKGLAAQFDTPTANVDCKTFNASRILRIPGTTARKGDALPNRPHRQAFFANPGEVELGVVSVEQLQAVAELAPKNPLPAAAKPVNGHTNGQHYHTNGRNDPLSRCRAYVAAIPGAIQGQAGSDPTLQVACETVRFDLDPSSSMLVLNEYNARCLPPWSEKELQHKLDDAEKKAKRGEKLNQDAARSASGQPQMSERPSESPITLPQPVAIGELIQQFPDLRETVIYNLARRGEVVNLIANPKFGKSWLTYNLALCVSTGRALFGKFSTNRGKVLIIDNELHEQTLSHRLPMVAKALEIDLADVQTEILAVNLRGKLADLNAIGRYLQQFEPRQFQVVVIDAFYRTLPAGVDENSNSEMTALYNLLDAIAGRLECVIVLVHHASKGSQSLKAITDVGSGAGAQSRAADTHLILRPHQQANVAVFEAAVRSFPPVDPICLRWEFPIWKLDESLDPSSLRSERQPKGTTVTEKPSRFAILVDKIIAALRENGPTTKNSLKRILKCSGTTINEPIESLLESGDIEPFQIDTNRGPQSGFRLTNSDPGQPRTTPDCPAMSTVDGQSLFREDCLSGVRR